MRSAQHHRRLAPGVSEPFDPRSISGLTSWWTAEDANMLNGKVVSVPDRVRPTVPWTQSDPAQQPTLDPATAGRQGLSGGDLIAASVPQVTTSYSMFLAWYPYAAAGVTPWYIGDSGANGYGVYTTSDNVTGGLHGGVVVVNDGIEELGRMAVIGLEHVPTEIYRWAVVQGKPDVANPVAPSGAGSRIWNPGSLGCEGLLWNRVLTADERGRVHRYLMQKWMRKGENGYGGPVR